MTITIDSELEELVSKLNDWDYRTYMCCSGHGEKNASITFHYSIRTIDLLKRKEIKYKIVDNCMGYILILIRLPLNILLEKLQLNKDDLRCYV